MRRVWVISAVVLALIAAYTWRSMKVTTELEYFLPEGQGERSIDSDVLRALSKSTLSRRMVFVVSGGGQEVLIAAAKALAAEFASLPLQLSSNEEAGKALMPELFAHRYHMASSNPELELPQLLGESGLALAAAGLKESLASPAGSLVRAAAVHDPLLLSRRSIERLASLNSSGLQMVEDVFLTGDAKRAVLFALSNAPAFEGPAQTKLWAQLEVAFARVRSAAKTPITIEASALSRHAVAAEKSMRSDVTRVSVVSTVAIVFMLWFAFVRLRYIPLLLLPLAAGFLCGTFACLVVFGRIHAMTFAFGSSLIGVCIDYPIHLVNHLVLKEDTTPQSTKHVFVALFLGCLTTVFGLSAMGWGGLPGLKEIALFGAAGVTAAFVATILWLPHLVVTKTAAPKRHLQIAQGLGRLWSLGLKQRWLSVATLAAAVLLCSVGLPKVRWQDDPQKLTVLDPQLEVEDVRVRKAALGQEGSEFVFLLSKATEQDALVANDELAAVLKELVAQGQLGGFSSVHNVLWSEALQRRNVNWVRTNLSLGAIRTALDKEDFDSAAFAPFGEAERDLALPPLRVSDLPRSVYDTFVAPWFVPLADGRKALLTRLVNVKDEVALKKRISTITGATYMNVGQFRSDAYALFRTRMLWLLGIGLAVVGAILWIHYRRLAYAVCAFGPPILSAISAVAALALFGQPLNLMHVMGLLLILSMGADYGIFLVESIVTKTPMGAPALSVVMACLSTVLSFGLLALSTSPALRAVGQTIGLGVVLAMVFSVAFATLLLPHQVREPT